jgi:hypothetical protein
MSPVWDDKMRDLYGRELRDVGMDPSVSAGERWDYIPAAKRPKGPPPDGTFTLQLGNPGTPFNSMQAKGTLISRRQGRPGHSVMHVRVYGRRLRVVEAERGCWIDFGGKEISWFPRKRQRRMAGK